MHNSNPGKTEVFRFSSRFMNQQSVGESIKFAGTRVDTTKKARNLGVVV